MRTRLATFLQSANLHAARSLAGSASLSAPGDLPRHPLPVPEHFNLEYSDLGALIPPHDLDHIISGPQARRRPSPATAGEKSRKVPIRIAIAGEVRPMIPLFFHHAPSRFGDAFPEENNEGPSGPVFWNHHPTPARFDEETPAADGRGRQRHAVDDAPVRQPRP